MLALRGRRDAVTVEDIADRLIRHGGAQIRQRSDDAIVAPAGILPSQAHHQGFNVAIDSGSTGQASPLRTIELAGDQPPIPAQKALSS